MLKLSVLQSCIVTSVEDITLKLWDFKQCLKHEQRCFIGFKTRGYLLRVLNLIKHVLRVF